MHSARHSVAGAVLGEKGLALVAGNDALKCPRR